MAGSFFGYNTNPDFGSTGPVELRVEIHKETLFESPASSRVTVSFFYKHTDVRYSTFDLLCPSDYTLSEHNVTDFMTHQLPFMKYTVGWSKSEYLYTFHNGIDCLVLRKNKTPSLNAIRSGVVLVHANKQTAPRDCVEPINRFSAFRTKFDGRISSVNVDVIREGLRVSIQMEEDHGEPIRYWALFPTPWTDYDIAEYQFSNDLERHAILKERLAVTRVTDPKTSLLVSHIGAYTYFHSKDGKLKFSLDENPALVCMTEIFKLVAKEGNADLNETLLFLLKSADASSQNYSKWLQRKLVEVHQEHKERLFDSSRV